MRDGALQDPETVIATLPRRPSPHGAGALRVLRWRRIVLLTATGILLVFGAALLAAVYSGLAGKGWLGTDFREYRQGGAFILATGSAYGRDASGLWYGTWSSDGLPGVARYPPPALLLFVAFQFIPWPLWWGIPLGVTAYIMWWWRPAMWSWPIMALIVCTVPFSATMIAGNTDMWAMFVIALATRWPAASWLLVAKPDLLLLTLPFSRSRRWWIGLLLAALVSLAMLPLWLQWLSLLPAYDGGPLLLYGLNVWPVMLLPLLAWFASPRRRARGQDAARIGEPQEARLSATA